MTQLTSIRYRLAIWYFLSLASILGVVAVGSWFAMRASLYHAVDEVLKQRLPGVQEFLEGHAGMTPAELNEELEESSNLSVGGGLFRIYNANGQLVYESARLAAQHLVVETLQGPGKGVRFWNEGRHKSSFRLALQQVHVRGKNFTIEVAEPLRFYDRALHHFEELLWRSLPLLVVFATLGGYWISRRALAPVDRITHDARAISASNLSARLAVPPAKDELQRLSQTLNQMLDRIESSFTRVRQFTADASHELRTPLTLIQTAAEFSLRRYRSREELLDAMQKILRETKRTTQLVNNLLFLARTDAAAAAFEPGIVDLTLLLADLQDEALMLAAARQIAVSFELPAAAVGVKGDEPSLSRLLLILIDNAIKYTPPGGRVSIELRSETDAAVIVVRDTGIGIAKHDLPLIFDRFWRADKVRSREMGGTGLGLSIAQWIVEQHAGVLEVQSELGAGSSFSVRLPKAESMPQPETLAAQY
jgi:heavy metal sensor kinase